MISNGFEDIPIISLSPNNMNQREQPVLKLTGLKHCQFLFFAMLFADSLA